MAMSWIDKLPFKLNSEAYREKWRKYSEESFAGAKNVYLFGTDKFRFVRGVSLGYVRVFNEKLQVEQNEPCIDHYAVCPICGKLMHVYGIPGTSYVAACSKKCVEQVVELMKEVP